MNDSENVLLIFVKNPEKGKVKTRLAETIGDQAALQVYHKLLLITRQSTGNLNCHKEVWYSKFIAKRDMWETGGYQKFLQSGGNLGQRMQNAFKKAFESGYQKAVIIGSDCPAITKEILETAFEALNFKNLVVGPSNDGGYYLLGMSAFYPGLFSNIAWSTATVLKQTLGKAENMGLSISSLPTLNDIDTKEDLEESDEKLHSL